MTREEAIVLFEKQLTAAQVVLDSGFGSNPGENDSLYRRRKEMAEIALSALRPVSREQVEQMRGEWVAKHRHRGGFRRATGVDDMGEQRTITIDERCEYDDRYCSKCGKQSPDNFLNFCGYCGAPMTDEAVQMVMKRWKEAFSCVGD